MKYIANLFAPIPKAPRSHVLGWSQYWAIQLQATILRNLLIIKPGDVVYIDHGVNFNGGLNLFGGVSDELAQALIHLVRTKPKLISLDIPMPDYARSLTNRCGAKSTSTLFTKKLADDLTKLFDKTESLVYPQKQPEWITVGDSHSTAYAKPGSEIHRTNGLTLHGLLEGWSNRFPDLSQQRYRKLKGVTIVAGSIDIRHHLFRQPNPKKAMLALVTGLTARAESLGNLGLDVELCVPVPVEYEDRPLPRTGYYNGTPFFGTQVDRARLTTEMATMLGRRWPNVITPPPNWYCMDPKDYATTVMERGGSVHIAPTHYRAAMTELWSTI